MLFTSNHFQNDHLAKPKIDYYNLWDPLAITSV